MELVLPGGLSGKVRDMLAFHRERGCFRARVWHGTSMPRMARLGYFARLIN